MLCAGYLLHHSLKSLQGLIGSLPADLYRLLGVARAERKVQSPFR
jgi:hypothetical protein